MTKVKLTELKPSYASGKDGKKFLIFNCPECCQHAIAVQVAGTGDYVWKESGSDFGNLTLTPSIAAKAVQPVISELDVEHIEQQFIYGHGQACQFHFFIKNGEVVLA